MKIVSWNCHYNFSKEKYDSLMSLEGKKFFDANIYAFQEVLENDFIDMWDFGFSDEYKYRHWYGDHQEFGNCHEARPWEGDLGLVLVSKLKFHRFDQGLMRFRYVVPYIFYDEHNNEKFLLVHVWTKSKPDGYFEPVFNALDYYKEKFPNLPVIMVGDFNFGVVYNDKFLENFETRIENQIHGFKKLELISENTKTFYFPQAPDKEYFNDCFFVKDCSGHFEIGSQNIWLPKDDKRISDHCPIVADISF